MPASLTPLFLYFLAAFAGSLILTPFCRLVSRRFGCVATPKDDRWHREPTALFGGVAVAVTSLACGITIPGNRQLWLLLACGAAIAAFGLFDDIRTAKPSSKLIVQVVIASLFLFFGYRLHWTTSLIGDTMVTLFWIVGITNAFNLLDNMDGLCAGLSVIAGIFLITGWFYISGVSPAGLYAASLVGATAGFLVFNFNPASIFLGDAGSLFLGLNFAILTLLDRPQTTGRPGLISVVAVPAMLLLIPIFDTALVTTLRLLSGRRPSQGGRDHTSHRLVAIGLSERSAVGAIWGLAAVTGGVALSVQVFNPGSAAIMVATLLLGMIIFAVYLSKIRTYAEGDLGLLRGERITPLVVHFMYKRRIAEVLLDLCLIPLAYYSAYRLRFEGAQFGSSYPHFLESLPIVLTAQMLSLFLLGGYRGVWRYFGIMDAVVLGKSVVLGTVAAELVILYVYKFQHYSRSVFIIYAALLLLALMLSRGSFRLVGEFVHRRQATGRRCLIYGSGTRIASVRQGFGEQVPLRIVGFVDDDLGQQRTRVQGYPILGGFETARSLVQNQAVDCLIVDSGAASPDHIRELEALCTEMGVELLTLKVYLQVLTAS